MSRDIQLRRGTSFIEVLIAMLILAVSAVGASYFLGYGRGQINQGQNYRIATQLASEALETLRSVSFDDVVSDTNQLTVQDRTFNRTITVTQGSSSFKRAMVTVAWGPTGYQRQVDLTTLISPN